MKVTLFAVGALIFLSSITGIFNNLVVVDTSAQLYEDRDAFDVVLEHLADDRDNRYNDYDNSYPSSSYEQRSNEYSSYDNYEPSDYGNSYDSSYSNDGYGAKNSYYMDDKYSKYPPKENKKYTCLDSGLVVDKKENCPVICPTGSTLEGHFVKAGSDLTKVCNVEAGTLETCDAGTDLKGVKVSDKTSDCNIFAICTAESALGVSLGLTTGQTVEVADAKLCQLDTSGGGGLITCPPGSNLGDDAQVTDADLCNAATPAVQCGTDTDLEDVWVPNVAACDIDIPPTVSCNGVPGSNLPLGAVVTHIALCTAATPAVQCGGGTTLAGVWVDPADEAAICDIDIPPTVPCDGVSGNNLPPGAVVTNIELCRAGTPATQCPSTTDLFGVWVNPTVQSLTLSCNISPSDISLTTNPQAQCLKCADLAIIQAAANFNDAQTNAGILMGPLVPPGPAANNVFNICQATDVRGAFNARITDTTEQGAFDRCLDNAAASPTTQIASLLQAQTASSQENSLTTNIEPEADILSLNTDLQNQIINTAPENSIPNTDLLNQTINTAPENSIPNTDLLNQTINTAPENSIPNTDLQNQTINRVFENLTKELNTQNPIIELNTQNPIIDLDTQNPTFPGLMGLVP